MAPSLENHKNGGNYSFRNISDTIHNLDTSKILRKLWENYVDNSKMILTNNTKLIVLGVAIPSTVGLLYILVKSLLQDDDEDEKHSKKHATSRQTVIEIPIPRKAVGAIIGRQGANIKKLQESSGARMNFKDDSKETEDGDRTLIIRGTSETAQSAECLVRKALADLPVLVQEEMMVPGYTLGRIIGRNGENIRQMSRASNTKIYVDRTRDSYRDKPRLITKHSLIQEKLDEEEEFRARTSVSASNREQRNKTKDSKHNHMTSHVNQDVSSLHEEWSTEPVLPNNGVARQYTLEYTEFPSNRPFVDVWVSAVADPSIFWVQIVNSTTLKLDQLSADMTRYFQNDGETLTIDKVKVGDIVAAPFENDNTWYRAKVMEIKGTQLDLFYIDYGDSSYYDVSECKTGSLDMLSLPCQAVECRLAGVKPKGSEEWTEEAFECFESLTYCAKWKVVIARLEKIVDSMPYLTLIDTNNEQDLNINEELIRLGHAEPDPNTTNQT